MGYRTRQQVRHKTDRLPITLRPPGTFAWVRGLLMDLSSGGAQIHSDARLTPGTELEIEFNTVDRDGRKNRRRLNATIMWRRGSRYGCRFNKP